MAAARLSPVDLDRVCGRGERTGESFAWLRDSGTDNRIADLVISPAAGFSYDLRSVGAAECRGAKRQQNAPD